MKIIGIAGGSGSGKSTLSYQLVDKFPEKIEMVNLDDYHRVKTKNAVLPTINGLVNWDHPDIVRWQKLLIDLKKLQEGTSVKIKSWVHRSNPDYFKHIKKILRTIYPREILILNGYLSLCTKV